MLEIKREAYVLHIGPIDIDMDEVRHMNFGNRLFEDMCRHEVTLSCTEARQLREILHLDELLQEADNSKYGNMTRCWLEPVEKAITDRRRPNCECPSADTHSCPYQEEINDDYEFTCTCCDVCRRECLWDI